MGNVNMSDSTTCLNPSTELKNLSVKHKEVAALLAQGLDRASIAAVSKFTPEYITWLSRQPLMRSYIQDMSAAVGLRLEAMFEQSVDVIADAMSSGTVEEKLKGARLQMEATGRVGRHQSDPTRAEGGGDKLEQLADRLMGLLGDQRRRIVNGTVSQGSGEVTEATIVQLREYPKRTNHPEGSQSPSDQSQ